MINLTHETELLPPSTNRGANTPLRLVSTSNPGRIGTSVCVDWIAGTVEIDAFDGIAEYFCELFGTHYGHCTPCNPGRGYSHGVRTLNGIRFSWRSDGSRAYLVVPGSCLRTITCQQQQRLLSVLFEAGFNATRIDIAQDWIHGMGQLDVSQLWAWCRAGYLSGGRLYQLHIGNPQYEPCEIGDHYGSEIWAATGREAKTDPLTFGDCKTLTVGTRGKNGTGYYTRIYEKGHQYGSSSPWIRAETEFVKKRANQVFEHLVDLIRTKGIDAYREAMAGLSLYRVCFQLPSTRSNGSGRKVLPEWSALLEQSAPIQLPALAKRTLTQINLYHFSKQYRKFLAKLRILEPCRFVSLLLSIADNGLESLMAAMKPLVPALSGQGCLLGADMRKLKYPTMIVPKVTQMSLC
jgi:hypothetical protein